MAANASTNAMHADSHVIDSRATRVFASLATLLEQIESGIWLNVIERDELAKRFELQLTRLAGTLGASSFGQFTQQFFQFLSLLLSCDTDCLVHTVT